MDFIQLIVNKFFFLRIKNKEFENEDLNLLIPRFFLFQYLYHQQPKDLQQQKPYQKFLGNQNLK